MPCRSPLQGYRTPDGKIQFGSRSESLGRFGLITFRCGMCRDCRLYRAREWAIRCYHEGQLHLGRCFITLTFAHEPPSIAKRDLQLFFKRLRKSLPGVKLRYLAVGEYGEKLKRPHYHICLFGYDFPDKYPWHRSKKGHLGYRSAHLESIWTAGHCEITELTPESAGYAARYTMKKQSGDRVEAHYGGKSPEFQLQSHGMGLGWIEKHYADVFRDGFVVFKGKECPIPYYYRKWCELNHPELFAKFDEKLKEHYEQIPYESGKRLHQSAQARDTRTKTLVRDFEEGSEGTGGRVHRAEPNRPFDRRDY